MKQYFKFTGTKWLVIINVLTVLSKFIGNNISNAAKAVKSAKILGVSVFWPVGALLDLIGTPFKALGSFMIPIFIADAVIIILIIVMRIRKKKKEKELSEEVAEDFAATAQNPQSGGAKLGESIRKLSAFIKG